MKTKKNGQEVQDVCAGGGEGMGLMIVDGQVVVERRRKSWLKGGGGGT